MNNFDLPWTGDNFTFLKPSVCDPSNNNDLNITSFLTAFGNYSYNNCYYWMAAVIDIPSKWCRINAWLQCQIRFYNQFIGFLKWLIKLSCSRRCNLTMKHTIIRYNMKYNFPIINTEIIFRVWMQFSWDLIFLGYNTQNDTSSRQVESEILCIFAFITSSPFVQYMQRYIIHIDKDFSDLHTRKINIIYKNTLLEVGIVHVSHIS